LKFPFEVEQVGAMPGKKSHIEVRLVLSRRHVHVAEQLKGSGALIVQLSQRGEESISLSIREGVGVLADSHHHRDDEQGRAGSSADGDGRVAIGGARTPEAAAGEESHRVTAGRGHRDRQRRSRRIGRNKVQDDASAAGGGDV
jgi:hypothetical protein